MQLSAARCGKTEMRSHTGTVFLPPSIGIAGKAQTGCGKELKGGPPASAAGIDGSDIKRGKHPDRIAARGLNDDQVRDAMLAHELRRALQRLVT